jgi:tetratricopeptide (TPR) repeat protein
MVPLVISDCRFCAAARHTSGVLMRVSALLFLGVCCTVAQDAEYQRARDLLAAGHAAEAATIYRELSARNPKSPDLLVNLTIAEYKSGRFREAAESASTALKLAPDLLPAQLFLGASLLELGEYFKAVEPLERVVRANPRERNGQLMLAEALLSSQRPDDAISHFQAAAELLPDSPRVWSGLGKAAEATGRKQLAETAWAQLKRLPPSLESHVHAAEAHGAALRWREAAAEWSEALKFSPKNYRVRTGLAWAQFRSRDYDAVMATLAPVKQEARLAEVEFLYGASMLNLQKPEEAIPHLKTALARDPKFLPARAALGQALLQTGQPEAAIPLLEESLSADQDGTTHFQLFRAYQLCGRSTEAKQAFAGYRRLRESLTVSH